MSEFDNVIRNYWDYYLELESEYVETKRYVDFSFGNFKTYSIEFLKLYQAVCSEIDVLGKFIACKINSTLSINDLNNINKWWIEIQSSIVVDQNLNKPDNKLYLQDFEIYSYLLDCSFKPWENFELERFVDSSGSKRIRLKHGKNHPVWWSDYNKVKHHRTEFYSNNIINFEKANLYNLSCALAALYSLELTILELMGSANDLERLVNKSKVFEKEEWITSEDIDNLFEAYIR